MGGHRYFDPGAETIYLLIWKVLRIILSQNLMTWSATTLNEAPLMKGIVNA